MDITHHRYIYSHQFQFWLKYRHSAAAAAAVLVADFNFVVGVTLVMNTREPNRSKFRNIH